MTLRTNDWVATAKRTALLGAALASAFASTSAMAASQGTLGATSTGTVTITASVPSRARITGLADVSFLNQDPAVAASNAQKRLHLEQYRDQGLHGHRHRERRG